MLDVSMHSVDQDLDVFSPGIETLAGGRDDGVRGIWRREGREEKEGEG
jgi:hypothetical protein